MKRTTFTLLLLIPIFSWAQDGEFWVKYHINQTSGYLSTHVWLLNKDTTVVCPDGCITTKKIGDKTYECPCDGASKTIQVYQQAHLGKWKVGEVKYTDEAPEKIIINPWYFTAPTSPNNVIGYIDVPTNGYVKLMKTYGSLSPFTMPFAIRRKLNDTIRSQATTDLNLGVGLSYNWDWVTFKNRRIKAIMTHYGFSIGLGGGLSRISLTANNTSLATRPLTQDESGLAFTIAPGIGGNIRGFHTVFFAAYDIPLTSNVKLWNYYGYVYLGLGFGVNLSTLGNLIK